MNYHGSIECISAGTHWFSSGHGHGHEPEIRLALWTLISLKPCDRWAKVLFYVVSKQTLHRVGASLRLDEYRFVPR
jgi:hypothetical protein